MEIKIFLLVSVILKLSMSAAAEEDKDIFTDYCRKGLCHSALGGDGSHTGCKEGVPHSGTLQYPSCSKNATIIPLSNADKQYIVDLHNVHRNYVACGGLFKKRKLGPGCRHGVVTWDEELEKTSFLHASYCSFNHDKCRSTLKYPFSGQNLGQTNFFVTPENTTFYINIAIYLWYVEYMYTQMDMINKFYHQTKWMVGHYLTEINESNNRVGCTLVSFYSAANKNDWVMLSCNYPVTNLLGVPVYNSCKEPASKCTSGKDSKYKFLCSANEKYDVINDLKYVAYDGTGSETFDNCGRKPELLHYEGYGGEEVKTQHKFTYPNDPLATEEPEVPTTKKPGKNTTAKPVDVPGLDNPEGNPNAGGEPDYQESEYDPPDSKSRKLWHKIHLYISVLCSSLILILRWQTFLNTNL